MAKRRTFKKVKLGEPIPVTAQIDAQKRVIYRYKSPFNFIFEPEFSTGSPVGEPGGARTHDTKLKRLVL